MIDSPAFGSVKIVRQGVMCDLIANEHGEADYAVWYHVIRCSLNNVLIVSKDTDSLVCRTRNGV